MVKVEWNTSSIYKHGTVLSLEAKQVSSLLSACNPSPDYLIRYLKQTFQFSLQTPTDLLSLGGWPAGWSSALWTSSTSARRLEPPLDISCFCPLQAVEWKLEVLPPPWSYRVSTADLHLLQRYPGIEQRISRIEQIVIKRAVWYHFRSPNSKWNEDKNQLKPQNGAVCMKAKSHGLDCI